MQERNKVFVVCIYAGGFPSEDPLCFKIEDQILYLKKSSEWAQIVSYNCNFN